MEGQGASKGVSDSHGHSWDLGMVDLARDPMVARRGQAELRAPVDKEFYRMLKGDQAREGASQAMVKAWATLQCLAAQPDWQPSMEGDWMEKLVRDLPDPSKFQAGQLRAHCEVWKGFFALAGNQTKAATQVLRWIKDGIHCPMGEVEHPGQQAAPFHKKKVGIVREMLQRALPRGMSVDAYLEGNKPKAIIFPNHRSTEVYKDFVLEELEGMRQKGVVKEWADVEEPVVVNGLRVVDDKAPKLRLCLNPMYINLFMRYQPVQYERLGEMVQLAEEGDYAFTTDDKSGYWQCAMHPSMWKYLAFEVGGRIYCFTHLPFGVAPACFIYTMIKQEIYRPLRRIGLRLVALIDDQMSIQQGRARTNCQSDATCRLLASLGWILSLNKCQLEADQLRRFLGMMVDLKARAFVIPGDKRDSLVEMVAQLSGTTMMSDRIIAQLAGKVMALAPALDLAPLLARDMMRAMQGKTGWDQLYPSPAAMKQDMDLLVELMQRAEGKGRKWDKRSRVIRVVGDASESALAAYTPEGELKAPIVVPFTEQERQAVESNDWSSTARELSVLEKVLVTFDEQCPGLLSGKRLLYCTDSQPGMQALMGMKGNKNTFPIVKAVRLRCAALDVQLEVIWRPRGHAEQQTADDLTKVEDNTDWALHPEVYEKVISHEVLGGKRPTVDVFASPTNTKVEGAYFSLYLGPGCKGVDAFTQRWDSAGGMAFINGPFNMMGAILRQMITQKVDAIVIAPAWPRPWMALWAQLPVRAVMDLPHRQDLFLPGSLVAVGRRQPKAPRYLVKAYYVIW